MLQHRTLFKGDLFKDIWHGLETYVGFGFTPWEGIKDWVPDVSSMTGEDSASVESRLRELWLRQREEESTWDHTTEGDRLDRAFSRLKAHGVYTAKAWGCCNHCHAAPPPLPIAGPYLSLIHI